MMADLIERGAVMRVLSMPSLDIRSDDGRPIADIMASFVACERRRTERRREQGIAAAEAAGRHLDRPPKLNGQQIAEARARIDADEPTAVVARLQRDDENAAGDVGAVTHYIGKLCQSMPFSTVEVARWRR